MIIGIDPDLVKSGVAVAEGDKLLTLDALPFFDLIRFIDEHKDSARFVVEDVETDKTTYYRPGTSQAGMRKIAQNVGQVKAIGRLICQYLEGAKADFVKVRPLQGYLKKAKTDPEFFNKVTGWPGRSNQDKRDAALLALFGEGSRSKRLG